MSQTDAIDGEIVEPTMRKSKYVYPTEVGPRRATEEQSFVTAFFACAFDANEAAKMCGIPDKDANRWTKMMTRRTSVRALMVKELERIKAAHRVTTDTLITEASHIAFANMFDFTRLVGEDRVIDLSTVTREQMAAVQELTIEEYTEGRGEDAREIKRTKVKLHPKMDAIDKLLRVLGAYLGKEAGVGAIAQLNDMRTQSIVINAATPEDAANEYKKLLSASNPMTPPKDDKQAA